MDYKKIFKSRSLRLKILNCLSFVPDKMMVKIQYKMKTGRKLNLKSPQRYTEKLQWYKLFYRNPLMPKCVDKYDVRQYIISKGLEDILINCLGVFERVEDINWESLPTSFVLKDTLGGGGSSVIIVKDKKTANREEICKTLSKWLVSPSNVRNGGREWVYYSGKKHRIIIEEYINADDTQGGLIDYKFFCYEGKPKWIYVIADRKMGVSAGLAIYDSNFKRLKAQRNDEQLLRRKIDKPVNFEIMKQIASRLSRDFPHARIDLYNHNGKILFGEITFFDGSGYMTFTPDSFDYEMGKDFKLKR